MVGLWHQVQRRRGGGQVNLPSVQSHTTQAKVPLLEHKHIERVMELLALWVGRQSHARGICESINPFGEKDLRQA